MIKASDITALTMKVTKKWAKQIKREERNSRAALNRRQNLYSDRINQTDVLWKVIPKAYLKASSGGTLPAHARQIYYAAREEIRELTDRAVDSKYFTQNLLPRYVKAHPDETRDWWVVYDPRGNFIEPHTDKRVPIGTLQVDEYLREIDGHKVESLELQDSFALEYPTCGTSNRISAVLFIEKEGFNPLFSATKLAERYDLAIMSTKGQSVVAARKLVDQLCRANGGVPLLVLHDLDKEGLSIAQNLTSVSCAAEDAGRVRYEFENEINVIDLGLRLEDVTKWKLEPERVRFKGGFDEFSIATPKEREFLRSNQRVELNAFASADFIEWIEGKLDKHGIKKLVPDGATIEAAYRRSLQAAIINSEVQALAADAEKRASKAKLPKGLVRRIKKAMAVGPPHPWDHELASIVKEELEDE